MKHVEAGKIHQETHYSVFCSNFDYSGTCNNWCVTVGTKKALLARLKYFGWSHTKKGWVCPSCYKSAINPGRKS